MLQLQSQEEEVGWWREEREQSALALENQHRDNELTGCKGYNTYMNVIRWCRSAGRWIYDQLDNDIVTADADELRGAWL